MTRRMSARGIGLVLVGLLVSAAPQVSEAATTDFQRKVSPTTSYTNMYDARVFPTATSTAKTNPGAVYLNYRKGAKVVAYFDISSIPPGSTVTSASLKYYFYNGKNIQAPIGIFRVRTNWVGGVPWQTAGGDWADKNDVAQGATPIASVQASFDGWYTWDVTPLVQKWVSGTSPNYGLMLITYTAPNGYGQAYGSGHASASVHPKLSVTFTPSASDTTPPSVSLTAPAAGATVSGTVTVSATASDNVGVVGVQFKRGGTNLGAKDTASPYSVSWNTTTAANGSQTLTAVARDAAGNTRTSTAVTVTVNNAPADTTPPNGTVTINGGAASTTSTAVTLTLSATDNSGTVAQMQFSNDGSIYSTAETYAASKSWTLSTGDGTKTVYAKFKDAAGNWSAAVSDTIILDATAPLVTITSPVDGAIIVAPSP